MHTALRQLRGGVVEALQKLPLRRRQQPQLSQPLLGVVGQLLQHQPEALQQPLDRDPVEQIGIELDPARQTAPGRPHIDAEIEQRGRDRHLQPRLDPDRVRGRGRLEQLEGHLEQRIPRQIPLRRQLLHQLLERHIRMRIGPQRHLPHPPHQLPQRRIPDRSTRNTSVFTKNPINPSNSARVRPADRRPHHHILLPAPAPQHHRKPRHQHHEQRPPSRPRQPLQPRRPPPPASNPNCRPPMLLHRRPRPIRGNPSPATPPTPPANTPPAPPTAPPATTPAATPRNPHTAPATPPTPPPAPTATPSYTTPNSPANTPIDHPSATM